MSIYYDDSIKKPFKTVTIEYFEEIDEITAWPGVRRIRVVTTNRQYNLGKTHSVPVVTVNYEYL